MVKMSNLKKLGIICMSAIMLASIAPISSLVNNSSHVVNAKDVKTNDSLKQLKSQRHHYHHLVKVEKRHMARLQEHINEAKGEGAIYGPYGNRGLRQQIRHNLRASKKWAHQLASAKHNSDTHLRKQVRKMLYKGKSKRKLIKHALQISQKTFNSKASHHVRRIAHRLDFDATSASNLRYEMKHDKANNDGHYKAGKYNKAEVKKYTRKYNKVKKVLRINKNKYHYYKKDVEQYEAIHDIPVKQTKASKK